jgi:hypothetical protein
MSNSDVNPPLTICCQLSQYDHILPQSNVPSSLLCSPDNDRNPITSKRMFHFSMSTSIQCAVTPRNPALAVLTVHASAVVEILPGAFCNVTLVSLPHSYLTKASNHLDICFQFPQPLYKLVMQVIYNVMSCRKLR